MSPTVGAGLTITTTNLSLARCGDRPGREHEVLFHTRIHRCCTFVSVGRLASGGGSHGGVLDVESTLGDKLPEYSATFGNDWDLLCASLAEVTARVKRSVERLRAAEALAVMVSLQKPGFMDGRTTERDQAFMDLGLYFEHDLTADGPVPRLDRAAWQRRKMESIEKYSQTLLADAVEALSNMIAHSGNHQRFFVFNPLSWQRTDVADFPYNASGPVHVVDLATGREALCQLATIGGATCLRVLACDVPPVGYKVFEIRPGPGASALPVAADAAAGTLANEHYSVTVNSAGAITSLRDKRQGGRELAANLDGQWINDFGAGNGRISVENAGSVSATLRVDVEGSPTRTTRVTLYSQLDRIDIANEITQNFGATHHWSFAFNLSEPDIWHEEVGAVIRARTLDAGGHYAPGPDCVRHDYQTLNHFVDIGGAGNIGVTLSNADCAFMKLGNSSTTKLDANTPRLRILAGGQVSGGNLGIPNQGGDTRFLQRFALRARSTAFNPAAAMRFALEHQNPLVTGPIRGGGAYPERSFSLLQFSDPEVLLWAIKPAEEGIDHGVILRLWNLSRDRKSLTVSVPGAALKAAKRTTHIQTDIGDAVVVAGALTETIPPQAILTYRLRIADKSLPPENR